MCVFKDRRCRRVFGAKRCDIRGEGKKADKLSSFVMHNLHKILLQ